MLRAPRNRVNFTPRLFDELVKDGRMPKPKKINSRLVWDHLRLDEAFTALPEEGFVNRWD